MKFLNDLQPSFDLTYSDVFMVPRFSDVTSRFDVDLTTTDGVGTTLPLLVSNMTATSGRRIAGAISSRGPLPLIPHDHPLATGAAGVQLLPEEMWKSLPDLEILIDANATPPLGIQGISLMDKATPKHGKLCYGAIGFGGFKLEVHRACIAKLFESNDQVLDAPEIYALAKTMMAAR